MLITFADAIRSYAITDSCRSASQGHSRHGPGQPLDRFPVSPSPCLTRHSYIPVHRAIRGCDSLLQL